MLMLDSIQKALAFESVAIAVENPVANRRDKQSQQRFCGTGVGKNKCPRDGLFDGDDLLSIQRKVCGNLRLLFIPLSRSCLVPNLSFLVFWVCRLPITTCTNCSSSMNMLWATVKDLCGCLLLKD